MKLNGPRPCARCATEFSGRYEHKNYAQRFCSQKCNDDDRSERVRKTWPTRPEMLEMVIDQNLSDSVIGAKYGKSYEWTRRVRNAYEIKAVPKPAHREIKHGRYIGRGNFNVAQKGEDQCRNCGAQPTGQGPLGALHLHHVIPRSMCKATQTDLRNGIPLCRQCHIGWHERILTIPRTVFTQEEWEFLITAPVFGQNVKAWLEDNYPATASRAERQARLRAA